MSGGKIESYEQNSSVVIRRTGAGSGAKMVNRMTTAELKEFQGRTAKIKRTDREGPIHKAVGDLLALHGIYAHHSPNELSMSGKHAAIEVAKAKSMGMRPGWPDWEFVHEGQAYFLEVKAPGGYLSELQVKCHAQLRARGAKVMVVTGVDGAKRALDEWGIV